MSRYELVAFVVTASMLCATSITVITSWFRYREKKLMVQASPGAATSPGLDQRLERIEQAVEAMALEVERISEGQRFATRLLTERQGAAAGLAAGLAAGAQQREERYHGS